MLFRQHTGADGPDRLPSLKRMFAFQLSLASLLGISLVVLIATGWVFAFGVIVGRGFEPEKKVPVLGRLVPQSQGTDTAPENSDIIKPEELTFFSDLKTQPTLSTEQPARHPENRPGETRVRIPAAGAPAHQASPQPQTSGPATGPAVGPAASQMSAQPSHPQRQPQAQQATAPQQNKPAEAKEPRYNFVYQVIAYKKPEQAEGFREKLESAGLRTKLQVEKDKQGKARLYRIMVLFKGTDAEADHVRETLIRHGIREPVLTSRKQI